MTLVTLFSTNDDEAYLSCSDCKYTFMHDGPLTEGPNELDLGVLAERLLSHAAAHHIQEIVK